MHLKPLTLTKSSVSTITSIILLLQLIYLTLQLKLQFWDNTGLESIFTTAKGWWWSFIQHDFSVKYMLLFPKSLNMEFENLDVRDPEYPCTETTVSVIIDQSVVHYWNHMKCIVLDIISDKEGMWPMWRMKCTWKDSWDEYIIIYLSKFMKYTPRVNATVKHKLWVISTC